MTDQQPDTDLAVERPWTDEVPPPSHGSADDARRTARLEAAAAGRPERVVGIFQ